MRRRLVAYFDRKNCLSSDELADETLNRVARRLDEEGTIVSEAPAKYCYITARFVFLESLRDPVGAHVPLDDVIARQGARFIDPGVDEEAVLRESAMNCLDRCAAELPAADRQIILNYYLGAQRVKIDNRRRMAERLGMTANALTIRACRIRAKLEVCVKGCQAGG